MTWELLRSRWTFPVLTTLQDGPSGSGRLLHRINEGAARNADLLGARVLHSGVLLVGLRQMDEENLLLTRRPGTETGRSVDLWELTAAGRELLRSLWMTWRYGQPAIAALWPPRCEDAPTSKGALIPANLS